MRKNRYATWAEEYAARLMEPADAARLVRNGDRVVMPIGSITPAIAQAIWDRREDLENVHVLSTAPFFDPGWYAPGHTAFHGRVELFNTIVARSSVNEGRSDFVSIPFSRRFKPEDERGDLSNHADVALIGISPPDRFGFCSYGLSMWNKASFVERARVKIGEIFPGYPVTGGANRVHVGEFDALVEGAAPPPLPMRDRAAIDPAMAAYVREFIRDGDTVQIGTGSMTGQLVGAGALDGLEELGVHSEITVPGLNQLVYDGAITGSQKTLHKGKFVATALFAGTPEEIEFIHENPLFEVYDVSYTNDIQTIARHDNMVAINNALTVDLYGQIACESLGHELWSGPGGQPEFAIGALLAKNGRSITVLPSAAKGGTVTRIVPQLEPGTVVTVPRQFADIVVTEHGVARLLGKSDRERANELISIAHPDHRAELRKQAGKRLGS
ncbi:MAG: acetyl-CoA hydrolase/transferase family protein [Dehalococcoidia bacterium]|nr:acetyl-CoA hydrolase/transferase family protein [Dehalococcoidia bacterium]MCA9843017.1 acetyl-CoA hydrolase/transferase family protein [Dehalococcoidia bacterium]